MSTTNWLSKAVFYEIYPQSFMDSNDDGIGDFQGIISKLDYIKELGCNAIWMNPCYDSPFGDAGYDVRNYMLAAPRYGTNDDLKELFVQAHERGMHVLLDLVPGHTSIDHPWFLESKKAEANEYTHRYAWTDSVWKTPEGYGYISGFSDRDGVAVVNFFSHQPALNYGFHEIKESWHQPVTAEGPRATRQAMIDVIKFWLDAGADGFRVDMAGSLVKSDPLQEGTIALWQGVFAEINAEYPEAKFVAEWGEPDKSLRAGFDMDFLLHFGPSHYNDLFRCENPYFREDGKGNISEFIEKYLDTLKKADGKGLICIPSGNHDMDRLARSLSTQEIKLAFAFLLSMPGAPFIYYGDEIGMNYVEGLVSKEGGYSRTGSRTPMQWDRTENAGFSKADADKLYLPIENNASRPCVEGALENPASIYYTVKKLIEIRLNNKALGNAGGIEFICSEGAKPLVYVRNLEGEKMLVAINPVDREQEVVTDLVPGEAIYVDGERIVANDGRLTVPALSAGFYKLI